MSGKSLNDVNGKNLWNGGDFAGGLNEAEVYGDARGSTEDGLENLINDMST